MGVIANVKLQGDAVLAQIVFANGGAAAGFGGGEGREEKGGEDSDDRYDDQKFDEGEGIFAVMPHWIVYWLAEEVMI